MGPMMSPVPGRCCRSLYFENVVHIPGNALSFVLRRGQAIRSNSPPASWQAVVLALKPSAGICAKLGYCEFMEIREIV